jgi:hypothetical protein
MRVLMFSTPLDVVHSEDLLEKHRFLQGTGYVNYSLIRLDHI